MEERPEQATKRSREALQIAKELNDKELRFRAELVLLRQALSTGDISVARAIYRRLRRLSPWISANAEGLKVFQRLVAEHQHVLTNPVSSPQQTREATSN